MIRYALGIALASVATAALAQPNDLIFINNVPALDEYGLVALMAVVATVGGWLARRRK
jgi:hypothetical protein